MPLQVVYGESTNKTVAQALAAALREVVTEGTVYLGYPVLATADERVNVDALLVSRDHGLAAFQFSETVPGSQPEWAAVVAAQDRLFGVLESHLGRHDNLRTGRRLAVYPNTVTLFPAPAGEPPGGAEGAYLAAEEVPAWVGSLPPIDAETERNVQAALQRVTTIKPARKRSSVVQPASRGAILKDIEKGIANLDRWQKMAAIESPQGPQRIRGLAGSGKTVVLALKAAYWHSQHPDWEIAVTFHSRALYQQIDDLVTRFTFEHTNEPPDSDHLHIMHSWGSRDRPGVYSQIAVAMGETPRDWAYARGKYGMEDAFRGICRELLALARSRFVEPIFDAVLIDEAQDLPPEFFQLIYLFTREPKRVVWAYDELQKLSESAMPTTDELFGTGAHGESLVSLASEVDGPRRDIVLPVCYRNTPWALATAHALGIGVYRQGGLLQHPDVPALWRDIGYNVVHGTLEAGSHVTLERSRESYPHYFERLLTPNDAVVVRSFRDEAAQDAWVAQEIATNLRNDELEYEDVLIVLPETYKAKSRAPRLMAHLRAHKIESHLVGVNTSVDEVFQAGSVAIAHIYRAKGNEAPMVYALDSQHAAKQFNAVTWRNTVFTAITRSRAWVRIVGWGDEMRPILEETAAVFEKDFRLEFRIPTTDELLALRHLHRDRTAEEEAAVNRATQGVSAFLEAVERGEMELADLPPAMRTRLVQQLQGNGDSNDE
jgi:superfamily I DNA and RNA helicase